MTATVFSMFRTGFVRAARKVRQRIAYRDLYAMPDHMLKDIGIARGEIERAVRYGRDRA